jgi:hypothetical protein
MARNCFIGKFRTGRQVAALPPDKTGERQLIGADGIMGAAARQKSRIFHWL